MVLGSTVSLTIDNDVLGAQLWCWVLTWLYAEENAGRIRCPDIADRSGRRRRGTARHPSKEPPHRCATRQTRGLRSTLTEGRSPSLSPTVIQDRLLYFAVNPQIDYQYLSATVSWSSVRTWRPNDECPSTHHFTCGNPSHTFSISTARDASILLICSPSGTIKACGGNGELTQTGYSIKYYGRNRNAGHVFEVRYPFAFGGKIHGIQP